MAQKLTTKTAYYLRAKNGKAVVDLQKLLKEARDKFPTVASSEKNLGEEVIRIQHFKSDKKGSFVHFVRYIPGERAPTLQPKSKAAEDNEGTQGPPAGMEFKDGDSFLLVKGHNAIFCAHGITSQKTSRYLSLLFEAALIDEQKRTFDLSPASNLDKLKLLQKHGVRAIQLSCNSYQVSLPNQPRNNWMSKTLGSIGDEIKALIEKDDGAAEQKIMEDLLVNVELRLDGNTRAAINAQEFIEQAAESVLEDADSPVSDFAIITQTNERITSSSIRLQTSFNVTKEDRSVSYTEVWKGLEQYFDVIDQGNLLEQ